MSSANRPPKTLAQRIAIVLPDKQSIVIGAVVAAVLVLITLAILVIATPPSFRSTPANPLAPLNYRALHLVADDGTDCYALLSTSNTPYGFDCKN